MAQSLSQLYVHITFHKKIKSPGILSKDKSRIFGYIGAVLKDNDSPPIKINGVEDHIHILCSLSKNISLSDLIKEIKRHSSRWIKSLGSHYNEFKWQGGYGGFSVSPSVLEKTIRYIDNQEERHSKMSFQEEYKMVLETHRINYDPRYLFDD